MLIKINTLLNLTGDVLVQRILNMENNMRGRNVGKTCRTHYKGTFNDGTQFDSSYDRGEPLEFVCGAGQMIKGFDAAVADMEVGEVKDIHLMPEEAYGQPNPDAIFEVEIADLPGSEELQVGQRIYLANQNGAAYAKCPEVKPIDTTGAGDIFGGSAVSRLLKTGKAPEELSTEELGFIGQFACTAASISTTQSGGIPSIPEEAAVLDRM